MALVLGRRDGQSVLIGDDVLVTVKIEQKRINGVWDVEVKLVFQAPRSVKILRTELLPHARR